MENRKNSNFFLSIIIFLVFMAILISLLAWITYGNLNDILGSLAYSIIGLLNFYPWIIPFIGIPLGILDLLGFFGFRMYDSTLNFAHLNSSWMSIFWYWVIIIVGILLEIFFMRIIISFIKNLKYREKTQKNNLALVNCSIIDGNKDSKIISNGVILIKNIVENGEISGLIEMVGSQNNTNIPSDYKKIDLQGGFVLPGLINAHCHLFGSGKPMKLMNLSDSIMKKLFKILATPFGIILIKNMMISNALNALNAGVTTLRTMGDPFYLDVKLKKKIEKGKLIGPRLLVSGLGLCPTGGHGGMLGFIADDKGEIRKRIRQNVRQEVDHIKILSTGGVMDAKMIGEAGRPQMTVEEIETACYEAHRAGLLVATHCESTEGMKEALEGGVDSIEHGANIPNEMIPLFKNNPKSLRGYTVVTPTISAGMAMATLSYKITKITPVKFENAKLIEKGMIQCLQKAYQNNIGVICGTDASVPYSTHYGVWKELKYYLKYTQMNAQEAIYFATKNTAELIGIDHITGSIEVGKSADIQIVEENPLENIDALGKVSKVIIRGHLISHPKVKRIKSLEQTEIIPMEV
ncbi:MAG: amidohydrolase family protein [Candidatus Thorarchaeota archaeon]